MRLESDSLRLVELKALGAVCLRVKGLPFWAIFDREYQAVTLGAVDVEGREPALTCRTCDVESIQIVKDDPVEGLSEAFKVKRHQPDGTGISVLVLKR